MRRSKRHGYWFGLSQIERSICTLALRLDVKFKSWTLLKALVSILKKLKEMGDELYVQMTRGLSLAWRFSTAAAEWGNAEAKAWRNDTDYARYLGIHMSSGGLKP
jgi:hypothetical protein